MDYIDKFKELRLANKLSQVEISIKLGLSCSAYGLYETRQRQMDIETFKRLCIILKVTPNSLLGFE